MCRLDEVNIQLISPSSVSRIARSDNRRLSVVIAGFGYNLDMPIFYYLWRLLKNSPTDVLQIDFGYSKDFRFLGLSESEQDKKFDSDIDSIRKFLETSEYTELVLIGKSLGSTACHQLLQSAYISDRTIGVLWLTPGTAAKAIGKSLESNGTQNLLVYGTKDSYAEQLEIEALTKLKNVEVFSVENGNHSLETDDLSESINFLEGVIGCIGKFLGQI